MIYRKGPAPVTSLPFTPVLLRPLPHTVTPFPNETLDSYRHRLAAVNKTDFRDMRNPSRWLACPLNELEQLELLSGQPRRALVWAIPELRRYAPAIVPPPERLGVFTRRACDHCGWRSGSNGRTIRVYIRGLHDNVCVRHNRWLSGSKTNTYEQINVSPAPEIVRAQILLNRLERRLDTVVFDLVYRRCERFWGEIDRRALARKDSDSVLARIYRPDPRGLPNRFGPVQRFRRAANFPQYARLTQLVISLALKPELERRVGHITGEIHAEFEHAFPLDYRPRRRTIPWFRDALTKLVEQVNSDAQTAQIN